MNRWLLPLSSLFVLIGLWEALPWLLATPVYVFPRFSDVVRALAEQPARLFGHLSITAVESLAGFAVGSLAGFLLGVALAQSRLFARIALPYLIASQAIPIMVLAPIFVVWLGNGMATKIVVAAFLCFFPLCINTYKGLNQYPADYRSLFDLYGGTPRDFLFRFQLPNALPYIVAGLKLNATFAVIGAIVSEFIASDRGLGFAMLQASYQLDTAKLWAYVLVSCALGVSLYAVLFGIEKRIQKRYPSA